VSGLDAGLAALRNAIRSRRLAAHSLAVIVGGEFVAEEYWQPYRQGMRQMVFSVSKTLTATAIGFGQAEGLWDIDDDVLRHFPSYAGSWARRNAAGVRIRDLLTMSTGHTVDTMEVMRAQPEADWVRVFFDIPFECEPGSHFLYNSGASFVLSALVQCRTGLTLREYLQPRLFAPLGISGVPWESNVRGINYGASGARLNVRELALLGQLFLDGGCWQGRQVLPAGWAGQASARQVPTPLSADAEASCGYGFQMWRGSLGSYRLDGRYEQLSVVLPDANAVIAVTAGTPDRHPLLDAIIETLAPALLGGEASEPAQPVAQLDAGPEVPLPFTSQPSPDWSVPFAGVCRLGRNQLGVQQVELRLAADREGRADGVSIVLRGPNATETFTASFTGWQQGETRFWPYEEMDSVRFFARAGWQDARTLLVYCQVVDSPFARIWSFRLNGQALEVLARLDNGFWQDRWEIRAEDSTIA
jgi:CubicO group peptidase (beta-lactamase class C family)